MSFADPICYGRISPTLTHYNGDATETTPAAAYPICDKRAAVGRMPFPGHRTVAEWSR